MLLRAKSTFAISKMTRPEIAAKFKRTALVGGEIVISIRGTIGRCAIVPKKLIGGNVSQRDSSYSDNLSGIQRILYCSATVLTRAARASRET